MCQGWGGERVKVVSRIGLPTSTKGKKKDSEKRHRYGFASTQMMNIKKVVAARTIQKMKTIQKCKRITNVTYHKNRNVYRSFAPQNGVSQREKFKYQLSLIKDAFLNSKCILLGDFNLNFVKKNEMSYSHVSY